MKHRRGMLLGALAIGLAAGPQAMAGESGGIPLPAGNFSLTTRGTEASCSGNNCIVLNIIEAGAEVRDSEGNACGTHVSVVNTIPPGAAAPTVDPITHVFKVIHYDPSTGTGDESLTEYFGGSCQGAILNSTGATQVLTGTVHFTISNAGKRIDSIVTSLTIAATGGYSINFTERQQQPPGNGQ